MSKTHIPVTMQMSMHDIGIYLEGRTASISYYLNDKGDLDTVIARIVESTEDEIIFTDEVHYWSLPTQDIESITEVRS